MVFSVLGWLWMASPSLAIQKAVSDLFLTSAPLATLWGPIQPSTLIKTSDFYSELIDSVYPLFLQTLWCDSPYFRWKMWVVKQDKRHWEEKGSVDKKTEAKMTGKFPYYIMCQLSISVTNTWEKQFLKRRGLFWLMVLVTLWLWTLWQHIMVKVWAEKPVHLMAGCRRGEKEDTKVPQSLLSACSQLLITSPSFLSLQI